MRQYDNAIAYQSDHQAAITIGSFDGVHIGHRKIIDRLVTKAQRSGLESVLLTFFPHPKMVLQQDAEIKLINTIQERIQIIEKTGIDSLVVHPFSAEFSQMTAKEYVEEFLVDQLQVSHVIIGYDHRFGKERSAGITDLATYAMRYNFTIEEISKQDVEDVAVSSTKIREALAQGAINRANRYLGYHFMLTGVVVRGKALGRTLKYPTANLHIPEAYKLVPKNGVYVVQSIIDKKTYFGMMNIGMNPTVGGTQRSIETHFFDANLNLYDKGLQLELLDRIRDEETFDSLEQLQLAMQDDEDYARDFINAML